MNQLKESYQHAPYSFAQHGERNVGVLKEAFAQIPAETKSDMYGSGEGIEAFQEKMATILGKEASVFFPSGTMAQQIALRLWSDQQGSKQVAYHPLSHLEIHEQDGLRALHQLEPLLVGEVQRLITLADVQALPETVACLLLELPQREIGGQLPNFAELEAIAAYCKEKGIILHLDGARLWECLPYYQKTAAEVCALFDSVYVSFYKGLGGIAGAILAGPADFVTEAKVWKRRHGGDLISLYPYVLSADYYYEQRIEKMPVYYQGAQMLAAKFNECPAVHTLPEVPVTNMFHVHFAKSLTEMTDILVKLQVETGIGATGNLKEIDETHCSFELSVGDQLGMIPSNQLDNWFVRLTQLLHV